MRAALVLALLVAGCAAQPDPAPPERVDEVEDTSGQFANYTPPKAPVTSHLQGVATGAAGVVVPDGQDAAISFGLQDGATGVLVELAWQDPTQDLDATLLADRDCLDQVPMPQALAVCALDTQQGDGTYGYWWNKGGSLGAPDSPSRIELDPDQTLHGGTGAWYAGVRHEDLAVQVAFDLYVTVFYDGTDPATFTAIPAA